MDEKENGGCGLCQMNIGEFRPLEPTDYTREHLFGDAITLCRESTGYELVYDGCMAYKCKFCPNCGREL